MSDVTSFQVTGDWRHIVDDGMVDLDALPDEALPTGSVHFTPLYPHVAVAGSPATAYTLAPITSLIAGGVLTDLQGREGVWLAGRVGTQTVRWRATINLEYQHEKIQHPSIDFDLGTDVRLSAIIQQAEPLPAIVVDPRVEALAQRLDEADQLVTDVQGYASDAAGYVSDAEAQVVLAKGHADRAEGLSTAQDQAVADVVVAGGPTTTALDASYVNLDLVDTGRLSEAALNATYESVGVAVQVAETAYDVHRSGAVGDGVTDDLPAITHAMQTVGLGGAIRLRPGHTYAANGTLPPFEGTVDARGARLLASAGMPGDTSMIRQSGKLPLNWIGGTIDGNKDNRPAPTQTTAVAVYIVEENDTLGWSIPTVFSDVTFLNHIAIPFRAQGQLISAIDTSGGPFDAINSPYAPVHVIRPRVVGGFYGISARLMRGWVCESPEIRDTHRYGAEDRQTAYARWIGGTVSNAGTVDEGTGHGWGGSYSVHPLFEGCQAQDCRTFGFVFGGGDPNYVPGYGPTWSNTVSVNSGGHGYSIDTTVSGNSANQRVDGKIIGAQAINSGQSGENGKHGVYLQKADRMTISDLTSRGAALGAGLLINGKHAAVSSSFLTENQFGVVLAGSVAGQNGHHGIGPDVIATGNSSRDWDIASHGGEATPLALKGNRVVGSTPTPEQGIMAPIGSTYRDVNTGEMWVKTLWVPGDTSTYRTGWKKITTAA